MSKLARRQSFYLPDKTIETIQREAERLDRSFSWIAQQCIRLSLPEIQKIPAVNATLGHGLTGETEGEGES